MRTWIRHLPPPIGRPNTHCHQRTMSQRGLPWIISWSMRTAQHLIQLAPPCLQGSPQQCSTLPSHQSRQHYCRSLLQVQYMRSTCSRLAVEVLHKQDLVWSLEDIAVCGGSGFDLDGVANRGVRQQLAGVKQNRGSIQWNRESFCKTSKLWCRN